MKVALAVNRVLPDVDANLAAIFSMTNEAASAGAELVVFPEAALTGLANNDDPAHDLPFGQPIPGPVTARLAKLTREYDVWLAIGLLERAHDKLYDTAVLLAPDGEIALKYRRIHPGWHGPKANPAVYGHGTQLPRATTPLGTFAFLICGDLFDDALVQRIHDLAPDWLLFPFARAFDDASCSQERWEHDEKPVYAQRGELTGVTTLMTNYLGDRTLCADNSFGGAMIVSGDGKVITGLPPGKVGILYADLERRVNK